MRGTSHVRAVPQRRKAEARMKLGRAAPENSDMIKKAELVSASRRSTARTTSRRWRHCHCCGQRSAGSTLLRSSKSALPASPDVLAAGASEAGTLPAVFVRDVSQATQSTASDAITAMRLNMHCSSKTGPRRVSGVRLFWAVTVSIVVILGQRLLIRGVADKKGAWRRASRARPELVTRGWPQRGRTIRTRGTAACNLS